MPQATLAARAQTAASNGTASRDCGPRGRDRVELVRVVRACGLGRARRPGVVVHGDGVDDLASTVAVEALGARFDQPDPELYVAEQPAFVRRAERRAAAELDAAAGVVEDRGRDEQVVAKPGMTPRGIAADRRDRDGVLEEPARVVVVDVRARGQLAQARPEQLVAQEPPDERAEPGVRRLRRRGTRGSRRSSSASRRSPA